MQSFMFLAIGIGALLVALALTLVLLRLNRTLFVVEALVETMTDEMRQTLPEVRESLTSVNEIASGMNVALHQAGAGLEHANVRVRHALRERALDAAAALHGLRVAGRSLSQTYAQQDLMRQSVDVSNGSQTVRKEDEDGEG